MSDRVLVHEHSGYPITPDGRSRASSWKTSFYIMDRLYNCEIVATFENAYRKGHDPLALLSARAERECARLNAWWQDELHSDTRR